MTPTLIIVTGLPCTGKSTIASALAQHFKIPVLPVDPIVAVMWRHKLDPNPKDIAASLKGRPTVLAGYEIAATLAEEQLASGNSVIIDAVSPQAWSREPLLKAASRQSAKVAVIQCVCSDEELHKLRTEDRIRNIPGMPEITWEAVKQRKSVYEPWEEPHLVLDSVGSHDALFVEAKDYIKAFHSSIR